MKQSEIQVGKSYLFKRTDTSHKKDMIDTIVTIKRIRKGRVVYSNNLFSDYKRTKPKRILLTNGRYCNAGELQELPD